MPVQQWVGAVGTVIAALIAAFSGSAVGALIAAKSFYKQRSFDRQLDWYERTIRSLYGLSEAIDIAMTFENKGRGTDGNWHHVQGAQLTAERCLFEAELYASKTAISHAKEVGELVKSIANRSNIFEPRTMEDEKIKRRHLRN